MRRGLLGWAHIASVRAGHVRAGRAVLTALSQRNYRRCYNTWVFAANMRSLAHRRVSVAMREWRGGRVMSAWTEWHSTLARNAGQRRAVRALLHKGLLAALTTWAENTMTDVERDRLHRRATAVFDPTRRAEKLALNSWTARTRAALEMRRYLAALMANGLHRHMLRWRRAAAETRDARESCGKRQRALDATAEEHWWVSSLRTGLSSLRAHVTKSKAARRELWFAALEASDPAAAALGRKHTLIQAMGSWRAALRGWRRALVLWTHASVSKAVRTWHEYMHSLDRMRHVVQRILIGAEGRSYVRAYTSWAANARIHRHAAALASSAGGYSARARVRGAFGALAHVTRLKRRVTDLQSIGWALRNGRTARAAWAKLVDTARMHRTSRREQRKKHGHWVALAVRLWARRASTLAHARRVGSYAIATWQSMMQAAAVTSWRAFVHNRLTIRRVLGRCVHRHVARAMSGWAAAAVEQREAINVATRALVLITMQAEARAMRSLAGHAANRRRRRRARLASGLRALKRGTAHGRAVYAVAMRGVRHMLHTSPARAVRTWRAYALGHARACGVLDVAMRRLAGGPSHPLHPAPCTRTHEEAWWWALPSTAPCTLYPYP